MNETGAEAEVIAAPRELSSDAQASSPEPVAAQSETAPTPGPMDAAEAVESETPRPDAQPAAPEGAAEVERAEPESSPASPAAQPLPPPPPPAVEPASRPSELPRRSQRPGALALLKLDRVDEDESFRLREAGDIDSLATSIAKLGQLFPVDLRLRPPDRFQIVSGFRRVAALRLLKRERVLARVHTDLDDEDTLRLCLAEQLEHRAISHDELVALRDRLAQEGRLTAPVAETLDRAIAPPDDSLGPEMVEGGEDEVDLEVLAQDVIGRLGALNQDLALVAELWSALDPGLRESLLEQLGYPEQLVAFLRGQ